MASNYPPGSVDVSLVWGLKSNDAMPLLGKAAVAWHFQVPTIPLAPKFNMEPENDGFQKESPFPGTSFQVPC